MIFVFESYQSNLLMHLLDGGAAVAGTVFLPCQHYKKKLEFSEMHAFPGPGAQMLLRDK